MTRPRPLVVPANPIPVVLAFLDELIERVPDLEGFTAGTHIEPDVTPSRFVRVRVLGDVEVARGGLTEVDVQLQVWAQGDQFRYSIATQLLAHLRAGLRAYTVTGPVDLPDPVDNTILLTQIVVGVTLRSNQA